MTEDQRLRQQRIEAGRRGATWATRELTRRGPTWRPTANTLPASLCDDLSPNPARRAKLQATALDSAFARVEHLVTQPRQLDLLGAPAGPASPRSWARFCDAAGNDMPFGPYRPELGRRWGSGSIVNILMLNPSTADAIESDPTVTRCSTRARAWGHDGLVVTNLFDWCDTDPALMKVAERPVSPINDEIILAVARESALVVCAWGNHGAHRGRAAAVVTMLLHYGIQLHVLRLTGKGHPEHPLYLPYALTPVSWDGQSVLTQKAPRRRKTTT